MNIITAISPIILLMTCIVIILFKVELDTSNVFIAFDREINSMGGPTQIALLISALFATIIGYNKSMDIKTYLKVILNGISHSIKSSTDAMIILLIIGALTSTWILSGIVPAMIYYGIEIINPHYFLVTACLISAIVSISTGSSWTTTATIGIAIMGIGDLLSISQGMTAGAIISGAYFGDKMSPLSETTNLAPSVAGSDLISHIKYMSYTTIPTMAITLLLFLIIGFNYTDNSISLNQLDIFIDNIASTWNIKPTLFLIPTLVIALIYLKISAQNTLIMGTIGAIIFSFIFQYELISSINSTHNNTSIITIINTMFIGTSIDSGNEIINDLFNRGGIEGMLWIILLVISAMTFGGVMYAGGFLKKITNQLISKSSSDFKLITSTTGACLFFNITTCDQYLAIVIPGRMFKEKYQEHNLSPLNLSRTIEDSGTVTSVLVPWNSCAVYHSGVLAINPIIYIPFCFFNIISPFMTILYAYFRIRIKKINDKEK
tara:strand:+ start:290 stop:1762 length:1473 start_codon:yes stop_codon:yes gene_type:complete